MQHPHYHHCTMTITTPHPSPTAYTPHHLNLILRPTSILIQLRKPKHHLSPRRCKQRIPRIKRHTARAILWIFMFEHRPQTPLNGYSLPHIPYTDMIRSRATKYKPRIRRPAHIPACLLRATHQIGIGSERRCGAQVVAQQTGDNTALVRVEDVVHVCACAEKDQPAVVGKLELAPLGGGVLWQGECGEGSLVVVAEVVEEDFESRGGCDGKNKARGIEGS